MNAKQLVTDYMQAVWVAKNVDTIESFVADGLIQHNPNLPNGLAALQGFLKMLFGELMPGLEWRVLRVIAEGDLVVVHSHAIPGTGALGMAVVDIFRVENGKIIEHWDLSHEVPEKTASGNTIY